MKIDAALPDGTRVGAKLLAGGELVGEPLPDGTQLLLRGRPAWKRIGESE